VFRHIDYMVSLVGPEHVGIGTDHVPYMPTKDNELIETRAPVPMDTSWPGLDRALAWPSVGPELPNEECHCVQPEQLGELVEIMLAHGYSTDAVKGILGANFKRVYATVSQADAVPA
jgi:membrane dipeptidase